MPYSGRDLQRTEYLAQGLGGHLGIERGGLQLFMSEQDLDGADIFSLLEQMSGERMSQRMHGDALIDVRGLRSLVHRAVQLPGAQRIHRIEAREQIAAGQHLALGPCVAPPGAQSLEQDLGQQRVAILLPFAFLHAQKHPLAVNVADLQCDNFAHSKSGAIGHRQCGTMLERSGRFDQATRLFATQHHRQRTGYAQVAHLAHQLGTLERHLEEKLESRDRGVERDRRDAPIHAVQLVTAQISSVAVSGERPGILRSAARHVCTLCVLVESLRIRMSSIMRRRSGEIFSGESFMALFLSRNEAECLTSKHTKQNLRPQPPSGVRSKSPYRASGLVHRPQAATSR